MMVVVMMMTVVVVVVVWVDASLPEIPQETSFPLGPAVTLITPL